MRYPRKLLSWALGAAALACFPPDCRPEPAAAASEFEVKAAYVYNFIQLVEWPPHRGAATGPVRICVAGSAALAEAMAGLDGRQAGGRKIEVSSSSAAGIPPAGCHVLVLGPGVKGELAGILKKLEGSDTLSVGDVPQFARKGGVIGFVTEGGKVRIEVNLKAGRQAGLKISARLIEVARIVK